MSERHASKLVEMTGMMLWKTNARESTGSVFGMAETLAFSRASGSTPGVAAHKRPCKTRRSSGRPPPSPLSRQCSIGRLSEASEPLQSAASATGHTALLILDVVSFHSRTELYCDKGLKKLPAL